MQITIYSAMADYPEYRIGQMETPGMVGPEWSGEVEDCHGRSVDVMLEALFRAFNRVDEHDVKRLDAWGYKLPSLSVGDILTMEGQHYLVASAGFKPVSENVVRKIKANPRDAWMIAMQIGRGA